MNPNASSWVLLLVLSLVMSMPLSAFSSPMKEIDSLPGLPGGGKTTLPSKWFSGHSYAGKPPNGDPNGSMWVHYILVEAVHNPDTAPLVLWYQGGPGASSLFGLFVEFGPYRLTEDSLGTHTHRSTGIPTPLSTPYSWSNFSNVLFVDNPPPVGFSYCDPSGPSGSPTSCGPWNDSTVAATNHEFLKNFISDNPRFRGRDLYITGESYAGVYVPTIVEAILDSPIPGINLRGLAVGDGCMGTDVLCGKPHGPYYFMEYMAGHGQFSLELHEEILRDCSIEQLKHGPLDAHCQHLICEMDRQIGGFYGYNLYDSCNVASPFDVASEEVPHNTSCSVHLHDRYVGRERRWFSSHPQRQRSSQGYPHYVISHVGYPCFGYAIQTYLEKIPSVRSAFHVPLDAHYFSADNGVGFNYTLTERNVLRIYKRILDETSLRVLIYNGGTDPGINMFITQSIYFKFMRENAYKRTHDWHPWTYDGEKDVAGYVTEYLSGQFIYMTLRGTGHMVGAFNYAGSFIFMDNWIAGNPFPPFSPS